MRAINFFATLLTVLSVSACETRSKVVAQNIYSHNPASLSIQCKNSIRSVEARQIVKNSSYVVLPLTALVTGGMSLLATVATNAGITLDDELNANRIAKNCEINKQMKGPRDIAMTIAANSTMSAITGSVPLLDSPIGAAVE